MSFKDNVTVILILDKPSTNPNTVHKGNEDNSHLTGPNTVINLDVCSLKLARRPSPLAAGNSSDFIKGS